MATTKTVRLSPEVKAQLREAATQQHRSLANMLAVMIRDWVETADVSPSPTREHVQASRSAN
jgi:predicted transcriptional regulator